MLYSRDKDCYKRRRLAYYDVTIVCRWSSTFCST